MHSALGFGGRDALYAVDTGFEFHRAVDVLAREFEDDLLVTAGRAFVEVQYFLPPAFAFGKLGVHPEQVPGKKGRFVAARTPAQFDHCVFGIGRVLGDEQEFYFLFGGSDLRFGLFELFARHFGHFRIAAAFGQQSAGFRNIVEQLFIASVSLHDLFQLLVLPSQFDVPFLVGDDLGLDDQVGHLVETGAETFQFFQKCGCHVKKSVCVCCICCLSCRFSVCGEKRKAGSILERTVVAADSQVCAPLLAGFHPADDACRDVERLGNLDDALGDVCRDVKIPSDVPC